MSLDLTKPMLLSGDLYVGEINSSGVRQPPMGPIAIDSMSITPNVTTVEQTSKANATYGNVRSSIVLPGDTEVAIASMDLSAEMMAMLMLGSSATLTQSSGTMTDEPVTGVLDRWVDIGYRDVTVTAVNVAPAGAALVEGTDYEIEPVSGMYKAISVAGAVAVEIDGSYAAISGKTVTIGGNTNVNRWLRLVGNNLHDGEGILFEAYRCKLRPSETMELMANQHVIGGLVGKMESSLDPLDASNPLGKIEYRNS